MKECVGHFGVIKLAQPVYHYGFMNKVKKILETVCHNCGKIKAVYVCLLLNSSTYLSYTDLSLYRTRNSRLQFEPESDKTDSRRCGDSANPETSANQTLPKTKTNPPKASRPSSTEDAVCFSPR
jgi:DNA-directed RNA polymerase beta' subunit